MVENIRLNWQAMDKKKKRFLLIIIISVLVLFLSIATSGGSKFKFNKEAPIPSVSGVRSLDKAPNTDWMLTFGDKNAAAERAKLREQLDAQQKAANAINSENTIRFNNIDKGLEGINVSLNNLNLSLAKESAERKQAFSALANGQAELSANRGSGSYEAPQPFDGSIVYEDDLQPSVVKISPFDMMAIRDMAGADLQFAGYQTASVVVSGSENTQAAEQQQQAHQLQQNSTQVSAEQSPNFSNTTVQNSRSQQQVKEAIKYTGGRDYLTAVPTGSLIRARLVSGMDAMVANDTSDQNQPVIAKITEPILLPNGRKVDLRGCVIMAGGYGNLSTERVYLNTTVLTCIDSEDDIYETVVSSNALGSDGKIGLRGIPTTRDGALVLRSMQAGLLEGIASAFSNANNSANQIVTTPDGQLKFPSGSYVAQSSLVSGVSGSLNQMVKRYNTILDQIFPVIQLDAGRLIEFQVLQTFKVQKK